MNTFHVCMIRNILLEFSPSSDLLTALHSVLAHNIDASLVRVSNGNALNICVVVSVCCVCTYVCPNGMKTLDGTTNRRRK